ncbi:hypothetical protein [Microbacterium hominis]|uniref:hypothetical protein n=1 Tax=Microbacterium hominis TaxID=162426 RepID=UPI0012FA9162|nr:hypothetical protein [Microbacterium hominis]
MLSDVHGPRKLDRRRQFSVPRALLAAAGIAVPGRVSFERTQGRVVLRAARAEDEAFRMMSAQAQVIAPSWVVSELGAAAGDPLYVRRHDDAVELLPAGRVRVEGMENA